MEAKTQDSQEVYTRDDDGSWRMDVEAFVPKPAGHVKIKGSEFPIYHFLDLPLEESIRVTELGDDIKKMENYKEYMERSIDQVILLNGPGEPKLTREHFRGMKPKQVVMITMLASSMAKVPLKAAAEGDSSSASSSPASAASTDGEGASSSA